MEIIDISDKQIIEKVIETLKAGGIVIFPSDTVYGLLADATNETAVKKLIAFKERPAGKAISIFVSDLTMAKKYVDFNERQEILLTEILPGPFTAILSSKYKTSKLLESESGTLGIRIPKYKLITEIVQKFGKPLTATSANLSSKNPHHNSSALLNELSKAKKNLISLMVDAGTLPRNKPSTVIDLTELALKILREGDVIPSQSKAVITNSVEETKKFGQQLVKKIKKEGIDKPTVLIIEGDLGVGKTVLIKGIGSELEINNIISPSYVIYYEYKTKNPLITNFIHFDLYNIQDAREFKYLGIENYLKPGNILAFEWGEKAGEIIDILKNRAKIIYVKMVYINESKREISVL